VEAFALITVQRQIYDTDRILDEIDAPEVVLGATRRITVVASDTV